MVTMIPGSAMASTIPGITIVVMDSDLGIMPDIIRAMDIEATVAMAVTTDPITTITHLIITLQTVTTSHEAALQAEVAIWPIIIAGAGLFPPAVLQGSAGPLAARH